MRMNRSRSIFALASVAIAAFGVIESAAVDGTASAVFQEPLPPNDHKEPSEGGAAIVDFDPAVLTPALYDSSFRWGDVPAFDVDNPNTYIGAASFFGYLAPSGPFDISVPFSVGDLDYFNGDSVPGTGVNFVDFKLTLDIPTVGPQDFLFTLEILNTINPVGTPVDDPTNADTVRFVNPTASALLSDGTDQYLLTLGFEFAGGDGSVTDLGNALNVIEGSFATAKINATLSPAPTGVPDGGSTLALLGSVFASLSILRRKRR